MLLRESTSNIIQNYCINTTSNIITHLFSVKELHSSSSERSCLWGVIQHPMSSRSDASEGLHWLLLNGEFVVLNMTLQLLRTSWQASTPAALRIVCHFWHYTLIEPVTSISISICQGGHSAILWKPWEVTVTMTGGQPWRKWSIFFPGKWHHLQCSGHGSQDFLSSGPQRQSRIPQHFGMSHESFACYHFEQKTDYKSIKLSLRWSDSKDPRRSWSRSSNCHHWTRCHSWG